MPRHVTSTVIAVVSTGLATTLSVGDRPYTVDILQNRLVTLDTESGAVGDVGFVGAPNLTPFDLTSLDGVLYAVEQFGQIHQLHSIDPESGMRIDTVRVLLDGADIGRASGLAVHDGGLLLGFTPDPEGQRASHLGRLATDGTITDVISFEAFDADFHGLVTAPGGGILLSVDSGFTNDLYRTTLDPPAHVLVGGGDFDNVNDLVFLGDELWGLASLAQTTSELFRIDPANGDVLETVMIDVSPGQSLFTGIASVPCRGDLDGDDAVTFADLLIVLGAWGPCDACPADLDGNGRVDFADLLIVLAAWGPC